MPRLSGQRDQPRARSIAGNLTGRTQTLPLAIFFELERDPEAAFSLSLILVAVSLLVLTAARRTWSR